MSNKILDAAEAKLVEAQNAVTLAGLQSIKVVNGQRVFDDKGNPVLVPFPTNMTLEEALKKGFTLTRISKTYSGGVQSFFSVAALYGFGNVPVSRGKAAVSKILAALRHAA